MQDQLHVFYKTCIFITFIAFDENVIPDVTNVNIFTSGMI